MRASRIVAIVVAALSAMLLTGVIVAHASFGATDEGYGATLAAAEQNARITIQGDYGPCKDLDIYADGQLADGTWWADISGECSNYN
jgi:hypothetical protein